MYGTEKLHHLLLIACCCCSCASSYRVPGHLALPQYAHVKRLLQKGHVGSSSAATMSHGNGSAGIVLPSEVQQLVGRQHLPVFDLAPNNHHRKLEASRPLKAPYNICVSPWTPFVTCTPGSTEHHRFTGMYWLQQAHV